MDIYKFLETSAAELPKKQNLSKHFPAFLRIQYDVFLKQISEQLIGEEDWLSKETLKNISFIQTLSDVIIKTVEIYYDGSPSAAYEYFSKWLSGNQGAFNHLKTNEMKRDQFISDYPLFRMRVHDHFGLTREQMFHIPFEQRHKVSTQRYSIPGYPCVYLGASSCVCWKELGHPSFDKIYLVRFEPTKDLNLLDLAYTPKFLSQLYNIVDLEGEEEQRPFLLNQVLLWPLKCACMVQSAHIEASFKPEYIIPQLLLQYVRNDRNIDGIRYYSTCFDESADIHLGCNYAFPVKTQATSGHCAELKQLFKVTEVMPWQVLSADRGRVPLADRGLKMGNTPISLVKGEPKLYHETIFGYMDDYGIRLDANLL